MPGLQPSSDRLTSLLRLLDDDTPEVRSSLTEALSVYDGDVSELLGDTGVQLSSAETLILSELLRPGRLNRLRREWIMPIDGLAALEDDWDRTESMFRMLSDYLHDGVTLRQPLGDALDLLADDTQKVLDQEGSRGFVQWLLRQNILNVLYSPDSVPEHFDLAGVAAGDETNAIGAGIVILLLARRIGANVRGLNLPGAFFLATNELEGLCIFDPAAHGNSMNTDDFLHRIRRYPAEARQQAQRAATPGELLLRVTEELATSFAVNGQDEDAQMMEDLISSLIGPS